MIKHGHILVNKEKVVSPSFQMQPQSLIEVNLLSYPFVLQKFKWVQRGTLKRKYIQYLKYIKKLRNDDNLRLQMSFIRLRKSDIYQSKKKIDKVKKTHIKSPPFLEVNYKILSGVFLYQPSFREIPFKTSFNLCQILEFYKERA